MAGLDGPVAEEHDGDPILAAQPGGQRVARGHREVAAHHAGGAHQAVLGVHEVHRAAEALAQPRRAAHQLRHHAVHRRALGQRVAVGAMAAVDGVVVAQLAADPGGHALRADAEVDQPVDLEAVVQLGHALLEAADPPHRPQEVERELGPQAGWRARPPRQATADAVPRASRTAPAILCSSGRTNASIGSL